MAWTVPSDTFGSDTTSAQFRALIEFTLETGDFARLKKLINTAARKYPENPIWHRYRGRLAFKKGHYERAILHYKRALRNGDSGAVRTLLGRTFLRQAKARNALKEYKRAPLTASSLLGRAEAHLQLGNPQKTLSILERIEDGYPDFSNPRIPELRNTARALRQASESPDRPRPQTDSYDFVPELGYKVKVGGGKDDNVSSNPEDGSVSSGEITNTEDEFYSGSFEVWHDFLSGRDQRLRGRVNARQKQLADSTDFNQFITGMDLEYTFVPEKKYLITTGLRYDYIEVGSDEYLSQGSGRLKMTFNKSDRIQYDFKYQFTDRDFRFNTLVTESRDGQKQALRIGRSRLYHQFGDTMLYKPSVLFGIENTEGRSSENEYLGGQLALSYQFNDIITALLIGRYRRRNYENPHIRSLFDFPREDEERLVLSQFKITLNSNFAVNLRWKNINNNSNLPASFNFEKNQYSIFLTWRGL